MFSNVILSLCFLQQSFAAAVITALSILLAAVASENGTRIEAEVRADHFSLISALFMQIQAEPQFARRYSLQTGAPEPSKYKDPFHDEEVTPPEDTNFRSAWDLEVRLEVFKVLRNICLKPDNPERPDIPDPDYFIDRVRRVRLGGSEPILKLVPLAILFALPVFEELPIRADATPVLIFFFLLLVCLLHGFAIANRTLDDILSECAKRDPAGAQRVVALFSDWKRKHSIRNVFSRVRDSA